MELPISREGSTLIAQVSGRIDGTNATEFHEALQAVLSHEDKALIMDFENATCISNAGLRVVLITDRELTNAEVRFSLCSVSDSVDDVFTISGFNEIVDVQTDSPSAVSAASNR